MLWTNQLHCGIPMAHIVEYGNVINKIDSQGTNLHYHILTMVDYMVGTKLFYPSSCFRA